MSFIGEAGKLCKVIGVGFNYEPDPFLLVLLGIFTHQVVGVASNPYIDALWFEQFEACCNHRGSNHIEDTIDITYHFSKVGGGIIDHFISTEAEQGLAMLSRSHGDHVCTFEMGKLDGIVPHTTSGTLDEDTLSRLQVPLEECLPGGERREGESRTLFMTD